MASWTASTTMRLTALETRAVARLTMMGLMCSTAAQHSPVTSRTVSHSQTHRLCRPVSRR